MAGEGGELVVVVLLGVNWGREGVGGFAGYRAK